MLDSGKARQGWRIAFVVYAVLCLSSMAGMSIGLGLFAAAALWYFVADWRGRAPAILREAFATPYSWISLALFAASLLSLVMAMIFPVEGSQAGPMLSSLKKFHYYIFPPLFAAAFLHTSDEPERHPFWKAWAIFGGILGVIAMSQFFAADLFPYSWLDNPFFRPDGRTGRYHGQGLMFFHLSFASSMCFVAASAWARVVFPLRGDANRQRIFWVVTAVLASAGVWFSYSRIAFAALAMVVLVLGFLRRPFYGLLCAVFVTMSGFGAWFLIPSIQMRFGDGASGTKERVRMWESAFAMFRDHPLTGVGFSRTGEISPWYVEHVLHEPLEFTSHAHNNILDMLAATGSIGFVAFLAWWGFLFWASWRAFRLAPEGEKWLPAAAITGFLAFHVNGLTQVNYWDGKSEHALMLWAGVAVALWIRARKRELSKV
ncbi:MAG: O-antigen ligase family protein [Bdellovibrionota bacterium]